MEVCERYLIRYSQFLRWDPDDRHKAVMYRIYRSEVCPGCGTHPDDWDPERGGFVDAYVAEVRSCRGCAATEKARERWGDGLGPGDTIRLRRFDPDTDDSLAPGRDHGG